MFLLYSAVCSRESTLLPLGPASTTWNNVPHIKLKASMYPKQPTTKYHYDVIYIVTTCTLIFNLNVLHISRDKRYLLLRILCVVRMIYYYRQSEIRSRSVYGLDQASTKKRFLYTWSTLCNAGSDQDPRWTQKLLYTPIFTYHIRS